VLFAVLSFNQGFNKGLARELDRTGLHFMIVPSGCAHEVAALVLHGSVIPKFLDTGVMAHVTAAEGIELATPILVAQLPDQQRNRVDLIYGVDMPVLRAIKPGWDISGRIPEHPHEMLLGFEVAQHENLKPGDRFSSPAPGVDLVVAGIVGLTGSQDDAFVYLPIETAQFLLDSPNAATAIGVKVNDPARIGAITSDLTSVVPGIQIVTMGEVMNSISNLAASARALSRRRSDEFHSDGGFRTDPGDRHDARRGRLTLGHFPHYPHRNNDPCIVRRPGRHCPVDSGCTADRSVCPVRDAFCPVRRPDPV
jgi:putative ABC transport system permease protein